jgi:hypothetical protein
MVHYPEESFTRHSAQVRSPNSTRRRQRLARLALACALMAAGGIALLALAV